MPGKSYATSDHQTIRQWAQSRGGRPARAQGAAAAKSSRGTRKAAGPHGKSARPTGARGKAATEAAEQELHIEFANIESAGQTISWEEFFERFDNDELVMVYEEETEQGEPSRYCRIVQRESVELPGEEE